MGFFKQFFICGYSNFWLFSVRDKCRIRKSYNHLSGKHYMKMLEVVIGALSLDCLQMHIYVSYDDAVALLHFIRKIHKVPYF